MAYFKTKDTDRGYAWVIMVNSMIGAFIIGIFVYSTGVIYAAVRENIDNDHSRASWVGSTLLGVFSLSGPLVGMMINKICCRATVVCGGLLILLGMIGASFAKTTLTLILSYGLVAGAIVDLSGTYDFSYVFAGAVILLASAMAAAITMLKTEDVLSINSVQRDRELTMDSPAEDQLTLDTVCDPMIRSDFRDGEKCQNSENL